MLTQATQITQWQGPNIAFWLVTLLVLSSAAVSAFSRDIIRAAFSLFFTLFSIAGYYVLLGSDFIAVTQIIIYVGGILVLLIFGVLLTTRSKTPIEKASRLANLTIGLIVTTLGLVLFLPIILDTKWTVGSPTTIPTNTAYELGMLLTGPYLVLFELVGVTLLLCLIGAAYLVRRKEQGVLQTSQKPQVAK